MVAAARDPIARVAARLAAQRAAVVNDDEDMVPLGVLLRELALDEREAALRRAEEQHGYLATLRAAVTNGLKGAVHALLDGKRPDTAWHIVAMHRIEQAHAGARRVWDGTEWRTTMNKRCKRGCRFCRRAL